MEKVKSMGYYLFCMARVFNWLNLSLIIRLFPVQGFLGSSLAHLNVRSHL